MYNRTLVFVTGCSFLGRLVFGSSVFFILVGFGFYFVFWYFSLVGCVGGRFGRGMELWVRIEGEDVSLRVG